MKSLLLTTALAMFLCVSVSAARAENENPAAPETAAVEKSAAPKRAIGSEVPKLDALSQKSMLGLGTMMVLFLLFAGVYKKVAEKRGLLSNTNQIQILSKKPVGPRHALLLVEVEGQRFFIAQTAESMNLISALEAPESFTDTLHDYDEFVASRKSAQS